MFNPRAVQSGGDNLEYEEYLPFGALLVSFARIQM